MNIPLFRLSTKRSSIRPDQTQHVVASHRTGLGGNAGARGPLRVSAQLGAGREHLLSVVVGSQCQGQSAQRVPVVVRRGARPHVCRRTEGRLPGGAFHANGVARQPGAGRRRGQNEQGQSAGRVQLSTARQYYR